MTISAKTKISHHKGRWREETERGRYKKGTRENRTEKEGGERDKRERKWDCPYHVAKTVSNCQCGFSVDFIAVFKKFRQVVVKTLQLIC